MTAIYGPPAGRDMYFERNQLFRSGRIRQLREDRGFYKREGNARAVAACDVELAYFRGDMLAYEAAQARFKALSTRTVEDSDPYFSGRIAPFARALGAM